MQSLNREPNQYKRYFQKIQDVSEKPQTHEYTTAIFSFLVVSLFGWYAIRPTVQTILTLQKEIEDNEVVSQEMEDKIGKLIEAQAVYDSVQKQIPLLTEALPFDPQAVDVVRQIRNLANISGATVSAVSVSSIPLTTQKNSPTLQDEKALDNKPKTVTGDTKIIEIPVNVILSGSFSSLQSFLAGTITMRRIMTIESFHMSPDLENESAALTEMPLRLVMLINAHYVTK